jgi:hypothetical protein
MSYPLKTSHRRGNVLSDVMAEDLNVAFRTLNDLEAFGLRFTRHQSGRKWKLELIVDNATIELAKDGFTLKVKASGIGATQLANNAVTEAKIDTAAVTGSKIAPNAVTSSKTTGSTVTFGSMPGVWTSATFTNGLLTSYT